MNIKEWLKETTKIKDFGFISIMENRPIFVCDDGFTISIQASKNHYCRPRVNLKNGEYEMVEIGFPNAKEELLREYMSDEEIYAYVPIDVVQAIIDKHSKADTLDDKLKDLFKNGMSFIEFSKALDIINEHNDWTDNKSIPFLDEWTTKNGIEPSEKTFTEVIKIAKIGGLL